MAALLTRSIAVLGLVLCATTVAESCKYNTRQSFQSQHSRDVSRHVVPSQHCEVLFPGEGRVAFHRSVEAAGAGAHVTVSSPARSADACHALAAHYGSVVQRAHADAHPSVECARSGAYDGRAPRACALRRSCSGALFCQLRASARAGVVSHGRCSGSARAADRSAGSCSVDARFRTEIQRAIADAHASHYASSRFATTCIGTTQTWSSAPVAADPSARRHAARCHQLSVSCVNAGDLPDRPAGCFCR
ncbi:uncharacterized protein [Triticum aestivum]|uniref:uncharacterized protein n=1 Tax=Triticum aestivum TaxID=4565 RepID=UPI001D026EF4|nr:uncharacterized protein LOC123097038 [Triticum aestivum]